MKIAIKFLVVSAVLTCSGCVYTSFEAPGGVKLTRIGVGTGTNIAELQIPTMSGMAKMKGYSSEQAQVTAAAIQAGVLAATAAMQQQKQQAPDR